MKTIINYIKSILRFIVNQGINTETSIREAARIRLSNGLAVFLVLNIFFGLWLGKNWDTPSLLVMWTSAFLHLFSLLLNRIGKHQFAKILVVVVANAITIFFSFREKRVDIYLFLIPISFLSFILFARRDLNYILISLGFSTFLLVFKLFGNVDFFSESPPIGGDLVLMQKIVHIELFFTCLVFVYYMFREGKKTSSLLAQEILYQQKSEEELTQYYQANLHLSQSEAIRTGNLDNALYEIAKTASTVLKVTRVNIWKYDGENKEITCLADYHSLPSENIKGLKMKAVEYPIYFKHLTNEDVLAMHDARNDEQSREFANSYFIPYDIYSMMDIPIKIEGKMEAIICFEQTNHQRSWTINEKEFGLNIASTIALAMETAKRKESNEQLQSSSILFESIARASEQLVKSNDFKEAFNTALTLVGKAAGVDRCYIFENSISEKGKPVCSQIVEWVKDQISSQIDNPYSQDVDYEKLGLLDVYHSMEANQIFERYTKEIVDNKIFKTFLEIQEILSILLVPIFIENHFWGYVGFDDCTQNRFWTSREKEILRNLANILGGVLLKQQQKEEIIQANKAKNIILSLVAHDLRNPIGGTISACNVLNLIIDELDDKEKKDELKMYINLIEQGQQHAFDIINDLLETAALENSPEKLIFEKIELNTLIHPIVNFLDKLAQQKEIKIVNNFYKQDLYAMVNSTKFTRAVENLLTNAIKYTQKGGEVRVLLNEGKAHHLITISDTGIGIPAHLKKNIFDKFTAAKRLGTDNEPTTGLGLFITKQIIEAHQGEIWVESTEGKGSTFYIKIPAVAA